MPNAPTTRLGLVLPSGSDSPPDVAGDYKAAFDDLDSKVAIDDQGAWPPPTATPARRGMYYWATDRKLLYRCTGTEWEPFQGIPPAVSVLPSASEMAPGERRRLNGWDMAYIAGTLWRFMGGPPIHSYTTNPQSVTTGSAAVMFTSGVQVAGTYSVEVNVQGSTWTGNRAADWEVYLQQGSEFARPKPREVIPANPDGAAGASFGHLAASHEVVLAAAPLSVGVRARAISASGAAWVRVDSVTLRITPVLLNGPA